MKKRTFMHLCVLLIFVCAPAFAKAGNVLILKKGPASIHGLLPDAWQELSVNERQIYLEQKGNLLQSAGKLLNVFRRQNSPPDSAPLLFVFHSASDKKVNEEQREKMLAWFEKNREVARQIAPTEVTNLSLENIVYLHDRDTIIFETSVAVQERRLHGVSAIIFLERGYLNIIGYETDDANRYREEFYSFIKTLSIPKEFKYSRGMAASADLVWLVEHWRQITGFFLFLAVYGLVFGRKGNKMLSSL